MVVGRYEVEAVGKLLGGHYFEYAVRGDQHDSHVDQRTKDVDSDTQFKALIEVSIRYTHIIS